MDNIVFTINTKPRTKKGNNQIIKRKNGKYGMIPSKSYLKFESECKNAIPQNIINMKINYPINVKYIFYCDAKRKCDLSNLTEAADDVLVKYGIIEDDNRDIIAAHDGSRVYHDKLNPRIEVEITELQEEYEVWKKKK